MSRAQANSQGMASTRLTLIQCKDLIQRASQKILERAKWLQRLVKTLEYIFGMARKGSISELSSEELENLNGYTLHDEAEEFAIFPAKQFFYRILTGIITVCTLPYADEVFNRVLSLAQNKRNKFHDFKFSVKENF